MKDQKFQCPIPNTSQCDNNNWPSITTPVEIGHFCINYDRLYGENLYSLCPLRAEFSQTRNKEFNINLNHHSSVDEPSICKPDVRYSVEPLLQWVSTHQDDILKDGKSKKEDRK